MAESKDDRDRDVQAGFVGDNPMRRKFATPSHSLSDSEAYFEAIMSPPDPDERYMMLIEREGVMSKSYRCTFETVQSPRRLTKMEPFRGKLLFTAEKIRASVRSNYHIFLIINGTRHSEDYFGKVRKVSDGVYSCFDNGLNPAKLSKTDNKSTIRRDFMLLLYDAASEADEQEFRTITGVVPNERAIARRDDLLSLHMRGGLADDHTVLNTRHPELVDGAYRLDFEGPPERVSMASPMNFVLQDKHGINRLQVGKMDRGKYSCDFKHPVSPFQAFALALGAFDVN